MIQKIALVVWGPAQSENLAVYILVRFSAVPNVEVSMS